jgi:hypothetical protein
MPIQEATRKFNILTALQDPLTIHESLLELSFDSFSLNVTYDIYIMQELTMIYFSFLSFPRFLPKSFCLFCFLLQQSLTSYRIKACIT